MEEINNQRETPVDKIAANNEQPSVKDNENSSDRQHAAGSLSNKENHTKLSLDYLFEEIRETAKKITETDLSKKEPQTLPAHPKLIWQDNADGLDHELMARSKNAYIGIANKIVDSAAGQLDDQNKSKNELKKTFTNYFVKLLSAQYFVLALLLLIRTFQHKSLLSDTVIITYITSVFAETLGAVLLMIKYAFDSQQETNVLEILKNIISSYKKFSNQ